jgi:hypothetical protein
MTVEEQLAEIERWRRYEVDPQLAEARLGVRVARWAIPVTLTLVGLVIGLWLGLR